MCGQFVLKHQDVRANMGRADRLTYYDLASMNYASFFLSGLCQNENRRGYRLAISRRLPRRLAERMMEGEWASILFSICVFKIRLVDKEFYFCIDARDCCRADPDEGMGYHLPLLDEVTLYFKVNYNEQVVRADPSLRAYSHKIIPVPLCFPVRPRRLLPLLSKVVAGSVAGGTCVNAVSRIKALAQLPCVEELRWLRNAPKDLDIFFVSAFYPEAQHRRDMEFRYQLMQEVRRHKDVASIVGFAGEPSGKYAQFKCVRYTLRDYLKALSRAKVAIYVRGLHDCLSFKLGQYLALGMPISGQTLRNNTRALYSNATFREQFAFDSPKEIVSSAVQLLREPDKLSALAYSNAKTFDTRLTPQATMGGILEYMRSNARRDSKVRDLRQSLATLP